MTTPLEIIDRVIAEHQINVVLGDVRKSMGEFDALLSLQEIQSQCNQTSMDQLISQKKQVLEALSLVQNRLDNHHYFEENALRPLFGELFMKALILEHSEIRRDIEEIILIINDCMLEGFTQADLQERKTILQERISNLCLTLEQHANLEEQMLQMLRKVYQSGPTVPRDKPGTAAK